MTDSPLCKRLKEARKAAKLSQKQLGIAAGTDEFSASARMNHYEKGRHTPDYSMLKRIAKVLNLPAKTTLKEKVTEPDVWVKVLDAKRTFWEKATILHQYAHLPHDKKLPLRISRHYYDFFCLLNSDIKAEAINFHRC